jgi:cation diffusion facilitator CzcD-associated flavoprotein CzcO
VTSSVAGYDVVVVGAGFGGRCAGSGLLGAGVTNFVILEKTDGAGTSNDATRPNILDRLRRNTNARRLNHHVRFGSEVLSSVFDDSTDTWTLNTRAGQMYRSRVVIAGPTDDAVVVGSGGLTMQQARRDGGAAYLGVAMRGFPNYFMAIGPDSVKGAQVRYIVACLRLMARSDSTRIEVRRSTQRLFNKRVHADADALWNFRARRKRQPVAAAFDLAPVSGVEDEVYDGPATLGVADNHHEVRVRLTGHLEPIDGRYHWQGMILDAPTEAALKAAQPVTLTVGGRAAEARITDQTPWGSYSVAGVGAPPFALDEVEIAIPQIG